ncbi:MAG TPA: hypothetical protein VF857_08695, partial [Spirochaetota bacterium]
LDTYGRIYGHIDNMRCVFIKYTAPYTNISFLVMNYLERKLHLLCGPNSSSLFFEKNKVIIYIAPEDYEMLTSQFEEFSTLFNGDISITPIDDFQHIDLFAILKS